jgi:hypothetical protein
LHLKNLNTQESPERLSLESKNMMQELKDLGRYGNAIDSTREIEGFKFIRIPVGTFGGTREQVFLVKDGQTHAFDTGDQGGGQS